MGEKHAVTPGDVAPGAYKHFKGRTYLVLGTGLHSETLEHFVIYQGNEGDLWIRPVTMFHDIINTTEGPMLRFERLDEETGDSETEAAEMAPEEAGEQVAG